MPVSRYVRKNRLSPNDKQLLKRIGMKVHRELYCNGGTTDSLSREICVARSSIREVVAGRSNLRILTLRAIAVGLGYRSAHQFLGDVETESAS